MIRYLLDTNALSEPVRPVPNEAFLRRLEEHRAHCAITAITWHEAVFGLERLPLGRRRDALRAYLYAVVRPSLPVLPYDAEAAEWHGCERARLTAAGATPSFADGQIAAIARTQGLVLVTANVRDFEGFEGVVVESWVG